MPGTPKNPFANSNYPIDYGITGRDIAIKKPENKRPKATAPKLHLTLSTYKNVEFERAAYEHPLCYDSSLYQILENGCDRHPLPSEVFSLIIDGIENKLNANERALMEDMHRGCKDVGNQMTFHEWSSLAFRLDGEILHCYEHPDRIFRKDENTYNLSRMTYAQELKFNVKGLAAETGTGIANVNRINPELIEYLFSRPFKNLPKEIRDSSQLWVRNGDAWPVTCYLRKESYMIINNIWAAKSRGVKEKVIR